MESCKIKRLLSEMSEVMRERARSALRDLDLLNDDMTLNIKKNELLSYDLNSILFLLNNEGKWCFLSEPKIKYMEKALSLYFKLPVHFSKVSLSFVVNLDKKENVIIKKVELKILNITQDNRNELYAINNIVAELHYMDENENFIVEFFNGLSSRITERDLEKINDCIYDLNNPDKIERKKKDLYSLSIGDKFKLLSDEIYQKVGDSEIQVAIMNVKTKEISKMPAGTHVNEIIFSF